MTVRDIAVLCIESTNGGPLAYQFAASFDSGSVGGLNIGAAIEIHKTVRDLVRSGALSETSTDVLNQYLRQLELRLFADRQ